MACYFRPRIGCAASPAAWSYDGDEATAVMDGETELISAFRFPARVAEPMKSEPGPPMTLGAAAAAGVRLTVWCKACQHQVEPGPRSGDCHGTDGPLTVCAYGSNGYARPGGSIGSDPVSADVRAGK